MRGNRIIVDLAGRSLFVATDCDSQGARLDGRERYTVMLPKRGTQDAEGSWWLSVLESDRLLAPHRCQGPKVGTDSADLARNADGSLTIYVQPDSPGGDKESNWLRAPSGGFDLILHTRRDHAVEQYFRAWLPISVEKRDPASRDPAGPAASGV
jgi:hypothetical protein